MKKKKEKTFIFEICKYIIDMTYRCAVRCSGAEAEAESIMYLPCMHSSALLYGGPSFSVFISVFQLHLVRSRCLPMCVYMHSCTYYPSLLAQCHENTPTSVAKVKWTLLYSLRRKKRGQRRTRVIPLPLPLPCLSLPHSRHIFPFSLKSKTGKMKEMCEISGIGGKSEFAAWSSWKGHRAQGCKWGRVLGGG